MFESYVCQYVIFRKSTYLLFYSVPSSDEVFVSLVCISRYGFTQKYVAIIQIPVRVREMLSGGIAAIGE